MSSQPPFRRAWSAAAVAVLAGLAFAALLAGLAGSARAQAPAAPERIKIPLGTNSVYASGFIPAKGPKVYVLAGLAGQALTLDAVYLNYPYSVTVSDPTGAVVGSTPARSRWFGILPATGDYRIAVDAPAGSRLPVHYQLRLELTGPSLTSVAQIQNAAATTRTSPVQIRVMDDGKPAANALVYWRSGDDATGQLEPLRNAEGVAYRTDATGYMRGSFPLAKGDELVALAPVAHTSRYILFQAAVGETQTFTLYHTSAPVSPQGLLVQPVGANPSSTVQTLTVAADNSLMIFDLDFSLEWDARADTDFLANLAGAIRRTSEVLYRVTNGQVALGHVRVFQAKEHWADANVVIYASNAIHPRATMGGIVGTPVDDVMGARLMVTPTGAENGAGPVVYVPSPDGVKAVLTPTVDLADGQLLPQAFVPGQIRMGPFWDPFSQSQSELQQNWWRALAHELAHYLLFLPDDYLGAKDGVLKTTNCVGSFMTNAYDDSAYGGFLQRDSTYDTPDYHKIPAWMTENCLDTVAAQLLSGRTDWETIQAFVPINAPLPNVKGPSYLPLAVTNVEIIPPQTVDQAARPLPQQYYDLRDEQLNLAALRQAEVYLYKTAGRSATGAPIVRSIIALGSTGSGRDAIMVRGAAEGDRLCVFDTQHVPPRIGCVDVDADRPMVRVFNARDDWQPTIDVAPATSRTVAVTVTQVLSNVQSPWLNYLDAAGGIAAQLAPAYGLGDSGFPATAGGALQQMAPAVPLTVLHQITAATTLSTLQQIAPQAPPELLQQFLPSTGTGQLAAPVSVVWSGVLTLPEAALEGFARVWLPGDTSSQRPHEALTQYFLSAGFGPTGRGGTGTAMLAGSGPTGRGGTGTAMLEGSGPTGRGGTGTAMLEGSGPTGRGGTGTAMLEGSGPTGRGGTGTAMLEGSGPTGRGGTGTAMLAGSGPTGRGGAGTAMARAFGANRRFMEAPISTGDGQITIFNLADILGDPGPVAVQAVNSLPDLPAWLTPVGQGYRFIRSTPVSQTENLTLTIEFNYLQRDVPEGYEYSLKIWHRPDGGGWRQLDDSVLDQDENQASAHMPHPEEGTYVLAATVALPPLQPGWNLLAYTVPETRTVAAALASIAGSYSLLYAYDPIADAPEGYSPWRIYDAELATRAPQFAALVNDLTALEYGKSYLIHTTAAVTPYMSVPGPTLAMRPPAALAAAMPLAAAAPLPGSAGLGGEIGVAPAVYYGIISGTVSGTVSGSISGSISGTVAVAPGMTVTAKIGEIDCGVGSIQVAGSSLVYALRVASAAEKSGCGVPDSNVAFYIAGSRANIMLDSTPVDSYPWVNSQGTQLDLDLPPGSPG